MVRIRTIKLKQPDTGESLPPVTVKLYPTLKGMRQAAQHYCPGEGSDKTYGFTQSVQLEPVIRFSTEAISMRIIVHECSHAALYLRYSDEAKWTLPYHWQDSIAWTDELFCHIMDDLFCNILAWLIYSKVVLGRGVPLEVEEKK
jgi:hypothetical protein